MRMMHRPYYRYSPPSFFFSCLLLAVLVQTTHSKPPSYKICHSLLQDFLDIAEQYQCTNGDCSNNALCISNIRKSNNNDQEEECLLNNICPDDDDFLSIVSWNVPCGCNDLNRCLVNDDCPNQSCCSLPSDVVVQASFRDYPQLCGPPTCQQADQMDDEDLGCASILYGTCMANNVDDFRPGYACQTTQTTQTTNMTPTSSTSSTTGTSTSSTTNKCLDQSWAEDICGYYPPTQSFVNVVKRCSQACQDAIRAVRVCSTITSSTTTSSTSSSGLLPAFDKHRNICDSCGGFFYQQCQTTMEDCPVGYCCSLPPPYYVPGFWDPDDCGMPKHCECKTNSNGFDSLSFTETIQCSNDECAAQSFGYCQEIGITNTKQSSSNNWYNPLFSCRQDDCASDNRTQAPTLPISRMPSVTPTTSKEPTMDTARPTYLLPPSEWPPSYNNMNPTKSSSAPTTLLSTCSWWLGMTTVAMFCFVLFT